MFKHFNRHSVQLMSLRCKPMESFIIVLAACLVGVVHSQRFYHGYLLRNPGLIQSAAASIDECISQCNVSAVCSAVSYLTFTKQCMKSNCNNLDIVTTGGWITYTLGTSLATITTCRLIPILEQ